MAEYLSPGVYIEEVNSGPRPIEGVGTAMAAFVGFAPAGQVGRPTLITNWAEYVEKFGINDNGGPRNPHMKGAYLSHSVYGYFLNGGGRCYVTRIGANGAAALPPATLQLPSRTSETVASLVLQAKNPESKNIEVEVSPPTGTDLRGGRPAVRQCAGPLLAGPPPARLASCSDFKNRA